MGQMAPNMESAVAYLRVSTQRQQRSGLGIEAQRATIARFAEAEGLTIIAEFIEAESGKGADGSSSAARRRARSGQNSQVCGPGIQA
jgi:DNA invertase Pin-like site-specific DNA recombinase